MLAYWDTTYPNKWFSQKSRPEIGKKLNLALAWQQLSRETFWASKQDQLCFLLRELLPTEQRMAGKMAEDVKCNTTNKVPWIRCIFSIWPASSLVVQDQELLSQTPKCYSLNPGRALLFHFMHLIKHLSLILSPTLRTQNILLALSAIVKKAMVFEGRRDSC